MSAELVVIPEQRFSPPQFVDALSPKERVAMATEIADAIKDVIRDRQWFKRIGESDHVMVEGWQFVASMAGATCKVVSSNPLPDGQGWEAHAVVVRTENGIEIGAGDGMCSRAERSWSKRDDYALRAMASTRATSRALRGCFSFIVELAGYRATPAEEMVDVTPARAPFPVTPRATVANKASTIGELHNEIYGLLCSIPLTPERAEAAVQWASSGRATDYTNLTSDEAEGLIGKLRSMKRQGAA